ncbi:HalOD1 output domain-containing protein [Haladaptatus sp. NG-SE-30]
MTHRVVAAVADEADTRTTELPPLYHSIDPDALNEMVERGGNDFTISFSFAGYEVLVDGDGSIEIG